MAQDKRIEDYLHLYLGAKYRWKDEDGDWRRLLVLTTYQLNWIKTMGGVEVQLLLRPLSDISEEEKREAVELEAILAPLGEPQYSAESIRFWLSKHFDLFDLIPEGLAIDKTTIK